MLFAGLYVVLTSFRDNKVPPVWTERKENLADKELRDMLAHKDPKDRREEQ